MPGLVSDKNIGISTNVNTRHAIYYLKRHLPTGFNISSFARNAIEKYALENGWIPQFDDDGNRKDIENEHSVDFI